MSKGLFNWSSYTEKKESEFVSPKKGEDTIPKPKSPKSKLYSSCKEQKVRVIRIYLKHRRGYIVGMLNKDTSLLDKASDVFDSPNGVAEVNNGIYVHSNQLELLQREKMGSFYIRNSSIDFLEEGKGWLIEYPEKKEDKTFEN